MTFDVLSDIRQQSDKVSYIDTEVVHIDAVTTRIISPYATSISHVDPPYGYGIISRHSAAWPHAKEMRAERADHTVLSWGNPASHECKPHSFMGLAGVTRHGPS